MNTKALAASLNQSIDRYASRNRGAHRESHDLISLSRRVFAPLPALKKLLATGALRSEGPVYANDPTGRQTFLSADLNAVRVAFLRAVAEQTIERCNGTPGQIMLAAGHALQTHVQSFEKKPGTVTEFARFPANLVQLARVVPDEEPGLAERATGTLRKAALVAGGGALAYGAASYLRGRSPGATVGQALRAGHVANREDLKKISTRFRGAIAPGVTKVAALLPRRAR